MKIILKVLSALATAMAVIDAKDLQLRPLFCRDAWLFRGWLNDVKNDRYSIFVGLAYDTDISVRSKGLHHTEGFRADLTCLEEREGALWLILLKQLSDSLFNLVRS